MTAARKYGIAPLLDGIRGLSGEKIQWYLAAELRDRIRQTGVRINVFVHSGLLQDHGIVSLVNVGADRSCGLGRAGGGQHSPA